MSTDAHVLAQELARLNEAYRAGTPEVTDLVYDEKVEHLRAMDPAHPYLHTVEPEYVDDRKLIRHPRPMLSTEKAYDRAALIRWVERVHKAAGELGRPTVEFRLTAKLDGVAGRDEDGILASRGNGREGQDITNAFSRGVVAVGGRGLGLGEIVIEQSAFDAHFSDQFDHPRNMAVGIISADNLSELAQKALKMGIVRFVPYATLPNWRGTGEALVEQLDTIRNGLRGQCDYAIDGFVADATDPVLREAMGFTSHHYRWQIAIKERGETAVTTVVQVVWQTGRMGTVTPVLEVEPVRLSGATISRISAHHAGVIRDNAIGPNARIEIIRSGEVIPKLEQVLSPSEQAALPNECPSCSAPLTWQRDFLRCTNDASCPAQTVARIRHWFHILDNADWFGVKTIERLVQGGFETLEQVYALTAENLYALGFGEVQTTNLLDALAASCRRPVEDARFLAAFGIKDLGIGDSRNLLRHFSLPSLRELTPEMLVAVKGFGEITSQRIVAGLQQRWPTIQHMLDLGVQLEFTPLASKTSSAIDSPIAGMKIVFTGKMEQGNREEMKTQARALGAVVQSAVSGQTEILVIGAKASAGKIRKAELAGAEVWNEQRYLSMVASVQA